MKNTIDDADYIIDLIDFIVINQCVIDSGHSHSITNEPFFLSYSMAYFPAKWEHHEKYHTQKILQKSGCHLNL